jgi:hypothetical protein
MPRALSAGSNGRRVGKPETNANVRTEFRPAVNLRLSRVLKSALNRDFFRFGFTAVLS